MSCKIYILSCLFCLLSLGLWGQTITGTVTSGSDREPMIGASVGIKGTTTGVLTDFDGKFEFNYNGEFPAILEISYLGYITQEIEIQQAARNLKIILEEESIQIADVIIKGQRVSDKQKAAPLTVESLDLLAIKETASDNFYDGLGALKGVDLTAASLGFKIINTRGFNSTSPVRSLQIIDGVDNQAPGLNFSLGNFLGSSDLDVVKVDIIAGASSAFYGPNAFNGVISMETKDPFFQKGLSVQSKIGERQLFETSLRWADVVKNKKGQESFGYKLNFFYLKAYDWEADNYDAVYETETSPGNPGRYDAVNIYGDEYFPGLDFSGNPPWVRPGLGQAHRIGYREIDLVDYNTKNIKANAAFHFRTKPALGFQSPELVFSSSLGSGTTVYQGDNRFSLRNILFFQNRIEFKKREKFFIRVYATHENAGDSYDPYFTALRLQEEAKTDDRWAVDYSAFWSSNISNRIRQLGYPQLVLNPETGMFTFDRDSASRWIAGFQDSLSIWHTLAAAAANKANPLNSDSKDFYEPGTERFNEAFNRIRSGKSNEQENGTRFFDQSALYHIHGEYKFNPVFTDEITVGANGRMYRPNSDGTIFSDTAGIRITNMEVGMYAGIKKMFFNERLTGSATLRADKNQNFNWIFTPAASLVYQPDQLNFLRFSFSSALRNPTLADQYLNLNVGRAILAGNLNGWENLITVESLRDYFSTLDPNVLTYFNVAPVKPERVKTFELGYRTTLYDQLFLDAGYYYSIYNDFLGYNIGVIAEFGSSGLPTDIQPYRVSANSINEVTTQGFNIGLSYFFARNYMLSGNYSFNKLNKSFEDDPIIPAFNTPEHKFNLGFSGRNLDFRIGGIHVKNLSFNINYKWIEGFLFEGSPQFTGLIPTYDLVDAQINYTVDRWNATFKLGASNILNNKQFQTYGGPRIGRLAYFSILYEFKKK